MTTTGYRFATWFFGVATVLSVVALPIAYARCGDCSGPSFDANWAPGITPVAVALLDWSMGFRLLLLTSVSAVLCLAATGAMLSIARQREGAPVRRTIAAQGLLSSLVVGILYLLAAYATGYVGYLGSANGIWMIGIPLAVALINTPNKWALVWTIPLLIGGWVVLGLISYFVGIPLY